MGDKHGVERMFLDKDLGEVSILIPLVQKYSVRSLVVDLYFDDG